MLVSHSSKLENNSRILEGGEFRRVHRELCTSIESLLWVVRVYYEFKRVQHELFRVRENFEHVQKFWNHSRVHGEFCRVTTSYAESCRLVSSYPELHEELYASYREWPFEATRHNSPKLGTVTRLSGNLALAYNNRTCISIIAKSRVRWRECRAR